MSVSTYISYSKRRLNDTHEECVRRILPIKNRSDQLRAKLVQPSTTDWLAANLTPHLERFAMVNDDNGDILLVDTDTLDLTVIHTMPIDNNVIEKSPVVRIIKKVL